MRFGHSRQFAGARYPKWITQQQPAEMTFVRWRLLWSV